MEKKNTIYLITQEDIKNKDILFNHIYANEKSNYYLSEDFSKDFYIELAFYGFISTSISFKDKFYLLPEIQFEYAILDFKNLHISKKVKKLLTKNQYEFHINKNIELVIKNLEKQHKNNWLKDDYKELILSLKDYKHLTINFEIMSFELYDKNNNILVAAEIGYRINSIYTSLTGFSLKTREYNNWGKLQLILLARHLEKENYFFWNLGHPYMSYKFDLGAITYSRKDFLKRWLSQINN